MLPRYADGHHSEGDPCFMVQLLGLRPFRLSNWCASWCTSPGAAWWWRPRKALSALGLTGGRQRTRTSDLLDVKRSVRAPFRTLPPLHRGESGTAPRGSGSLSGPFPGPNRDTNRDTPPPHPRIFGFCCQLRLNPQVRATELAQVDAASGDPSRPIPP